METVRERDTKEDRAPDCGSVQRHCSAFGRHVQCEIERARRKHAPINSAHEGYAVILEELDEFWDEVKKKREDRNPMRMYDELLQIAAMAQRTAEDVVCPMVRVQCAASDRGDHQLGHAEGCGSNTEARHERR